ncbi:hypothetical protein CF335_g9141 [Tilletia laevis]|nr:hypothetical protein CF335_g9141 [Tilletia laevis]
MSSPERQQWAKAFEAELGYLIKNETLEEVVLPHGAKVVSTKQRSAWVWLRLSPELTRSWGFADSALLRRRAPPEADRGTHF